MYQSRKWTAKVHVVHVQYRPEISEQRKRKTCASFFALTRFQKRVIKRVSPAHFYHCYLPPEICFVRHFFWKTKVYVVPKMLTDLNLHNVRNIHSSIHIKFPDRFDEVYLFPKRSSHLESWICFDPSSHTCLKVQVLEQGFTF